MQPCATKANANTVVETLKFVFCVIRPPIDGPTVLPTDVKDVHSPEMTPFNATLFSNPIPREDRTMSEIVGTEAMARPIAITTLDDRKSHISLSGKNASRDDGARKNSAKPATKRPPMMTRFVPHLSATRPTKGADMI